MCYAIETIREYVVVLSPTIEASRKPLVRAPGPDDGGILTPFLFLKVLSCSLAASPTVELDTGWPHCVLVVSQG